MGEREVHWNQTAEYPSLFWMIHAFGTQRPHLQSTSTQSLVYTSTLVHLQRLVHSYLTQEVLGPLTRDLHKVKLWYDTTRLKEKSKEVFHI